MPRKRGPKARPVDRKSKRSSSNKRWNNREDIPLDEVDEFHEQRDKILLDGDEVAQDNDEEEEVFALDGLAESSEDEDEDEEKEEFVEEAAPKKSEKTKAKKPDKGSKLKKKKKDESSEEEEEEEEESWGQKKSAYYSSNAAQLESDDEEAHEMEEQEARRIQAKLREPMREEDFGFLDAQQVSIQARAEGDDSDIWKPAARPLPTPEGTDRMSILRHMEKTCPETLALAQDWEDVARSVVRTEKKLTEMQNSNSNDKALGLLHIYHQAQLMYAALLAFYLHLRTSERYASRPDLLQQHPVLKRLLILKQSLTTLDDLGFSLSDSEDELDEDESESDSEGSAFDGMDTWLAARRLGLDVGELEDILQDSKKTDPEKLVNRLNSKPKKKADEQPKKKRKVTNGDAVPKVVFDVEEPTLPKKRSSVKDKSQSASTTQGSAVTDAYGEATGLDAADAADKGGRRRAIRFHTSKIESASARRENARNALGGDEDIPYRQRRKQAELRKSSTNLGMGGDDLDGEEPQPQQRTKRARDDDDDEGSAEEGDDDDGYYSLIKKQKKHKKAQKQVEYESQKEALRGMRFDDDTVEGQRGVTRAILANKGLTPRRSKSVRNPRVKKRLKFEKAKKKIASQKAVYKGGLNETGGHYGGEKSGISKVVKSVKF